MFRLHNFFSYVWKQWLVLARCYCKRRAAIVCTSARTMSALNMTNVHVHETQDFTKPGYNKYMLSTAKNPRMLCYNLINHLIGPTKNIHSPFCEKKAFRILI